MNLKVFSPPPFPNFLQNNIHMEECSINPYLTVRKHFFSFKPRSYKGVQHEKSMFRNRNCSSSFFTPWSNPTPLSRPGSNAVSSGRSFWVLVPSSPTVFSELSPLPESLSLIDFALYYSCVACLMFASHWSKGPMRAWTESSAALSPTADLCTQSVFMQCLLQSANSLLVNEKRVYV